MRSKLFFAATVSFLIISVLFVIWAARVPARPNFCGDPQVIVRTLDPSLDKFGEQWKVEIARRFPNALAVFVHGNEVADGVWAVHTGNGMIPVKDIVLYWQSKYPTRTIVVLSCNPGHLKLGIPGVWYFRNSVWLVPDRACQPEDIIRLSGRRRMTIDDVLAPCTQPATKPAPIFPFLPPFDLPPSIFPFQKSMPMMDTSNRWEVDPEVNGNIFEAVTDDAP